MKFLLVSDSHGDKSMLDKVVKIEKDIDVYLHLGDSQLASYLLHPFLAIRGNCDYFSDAPLEKEISWLGYKIHLEHGIGFMRSLNKEAYLKSLNCDIFIFGHTHQRLFTKIDNIYVINPGSINRPRDNDKGTYAILEIDDKTKEINVIFKEID